MKLTKNEQFIFNILSDLLSDYEQGFSDVDFSELMLEIVKPRHIQANMEIIQEIFSGDDVKTAYNKVKGYVGSLVKKGLIDVEDYDNGQFRTQFYHLVK